MADEREHAGDHRRAHEQRRGGTTEDGVADDPTHGGEYDIAPDARGQRARRSLGTGARSPAAGAGRAERHAQRRGAAARARLGRLA